MASRRQSSAALHARRTVQPVLTREGGKVRKARRRRRWTQTQLGDRVGLAQATVSRMERGDGGSLSINTWQQVATALELNFDLTVGRDPREEPVDAGHLAIQELVLLLGRLTGRRRNFELATKPSDPTLSTDVGLTDDVNRQLLQIECVNTFGNINAAIPSADRKRTEAEALAISVGHGEPYSVHQCWVVRATRRNRELLGRYPELFATRFSGSSKAWVDALTKGTPAPKELGLVWCDLQATRIFEWRPRARSVRLEAAN